MKHLLVCYDIPDDRRRSAVAKILGSYGDRVQYSVFLCVVSRAGEVRLRGAVGRAVAGDVDSVMYADLGSGPSRITWEGVRREVFDERSLIF